MIFSFIFSYYIIRDITKLNKYYSEEESQNWLLKRQPQAINDNTFKRKIIKSLYLLLIILILNDI